MTLPNWVTLSRLLALPILLYYLENPTPQTRWLSVGIFLIAAMTDWVDGYLARRLNQITELGKFLDPLVDKLLILAPLLPLIKLEQVPAWGVFLILARELTVAGWRVTPSLTGTTAITGANFWGKLKTVSQIAAIALLIAPLPVTWQFLSLIAFWVAVALTLISGAIYLLPATDKISSSAEKSTSAVSRPDAR
ncbi:CDP-diacylglycerol--glycerol-3-phosphate 3-phosphatidyltransferase [Chroogloeocystis siderophila]|jgi:CDP-diacylglycerol--glycerol-3-phosphate 3-phosphatidyltransferase|uniref:CDP-diacylglycerol--glycerol-3-phosphate 3-phosphatidyltransferase n=1 Tax=Chroogloeocystis siderophila 5.2 s.c.1 TaxID=247279 RepID=A0A1U7HY71_9CHRO|nr:CDP-diacylglycerol--glycerol-3-phosphate 3-phosphatidyltransferase [Chroogloeocystis siderophila]OKH28558.1 CDP-diacylglycerol--glycerol-3-phosphate 3-phosphatidyltransferase [Chroogloeocystis siderophila 5.2 s.c.1]